MRTHRPGAALALALLVAACGGGETEAAGAIPRARFVAANVALRTVPDTAGNADALRADSLKKYRVSEKELKSFVAAHGRDPGYMAAVWKEISEKVEKAHERSFPRAGERPAPAPEGEPITIPPDMMPSVPPPPPGTQVPIPATLPPPGEARPPRRVPPPPRQSPPPPPQPPREMVRGVPPARRDSVVRPPAGPPPDARRPWQPPPGDTLVRPTPRPPR